MTSTTPTDTIVAPATPVGRSALAIVRIDGPEAHHVLESMTQGTLFEPRMATHTQLYDADEIVDDCIVVRYVAPQSFTGNDLVELTIHGSQYLIQRIVEMCVTRGARMAEPGEFTERAVLNGKIDLVQAESIGDLIDSRTALQARLSLRQLRGELSEVAEAARATLIGVIARLEAALDFSEEGYEFITRAEATQQIDEVLRGAQRLLHTYERGRATTAGLQAVILGRPNAGKSTLLNRLVGSERAIVTPIPGTTRDIVRETIEIGGLPVTFADTAGIRSGAEIVEEMGIERARAAARTADIVLYLIDASAGRSQEDDQEIAALDRRTLVVYSKSDLGGVPHDALSIAATQPDGIQSLLRELDQIVREEFAVAESAPAIVNSRQRMALATTIAALQTARESLVEGHDEQIVLVDLQRAAAALGSLTGAITSEDVLDEIFSKFCIGK